MKSFSHRGFRWQLITSLIFLITIQVSFGQAKENGDSTNKKLPPLFGSDEILKLTISGDVRNLIRDKGDHDQYYNVSINYKSEADTPVIIDMKAKLRGHFRRESGTCNLPPILLNFPKNDTVKHSVFKQQDKLKLVVTCVRGDYVQREYLVYKLYQMLTPFCFRVRLVEVNFVADNLNKNERTPFIGFLIEEDDAMAKRNNSTMLKDVQLAPTSTDMNAYLTMVFFQYMVANVDWSVQYQHNIEVMQPDNADKPVVVAYDFDHAGIVNAPYAFPPEELNMSSVRERRYRGICITDLSVFSDVINLFNSHKQQFYDLYKNTNLVSEGYKKDTYEFLDEFFDTINNKDKISKEVTVACKEAASGEIIIKGLPKKNE